MCIVEVLRAIIFNHSAATERERSRETEKERDPSTSCSALNNALNLTCNFRVIDEAWVNYAYEICMGLHIIMPGKEYEMRKSAQCAKFN